VSAMQAKSNPHTPAPPVGVLRVESQKAGARVAESESEKEAEK